MSDIFEGRPRGQRANAWREQLHAAEEEDLFEEKEEQKGPGNDLDEGAPEGEELERKESELKLDAHALATGVVTESARACSYYSMSTGMQTAHPRLYHFDPRVKKCVIHDL